MAGITSLLLGFGFFMRFLMKASPARVEYVKMDVALSVVFILGVAVRKLVDQGAMDLSLEGALLAGFLGGAWVGTGVGAAIGAVCYIFGETVALPFYAAAGLTSGLLFSFLREGGELWSYSLNPFLIIYNFLEKLFKGRLDRNFIPFAVCLLFNLAKYGLLRRFGSRLLYGYVPRDAFLVALDFMVVVYALGVALKMVNVARIEIIMREEEKQLIHARLATLKGQINPHFLFNTLNSISALIRTDSEKAREMTRRLSSFFRKSLEDKSDTQTLGDELRFIDDYLSIERVRFGDDKLKLVKNIGPETLGCEVPALILQPLVENAIKHGISKVVDGGFLRIASKSVRGGIEVEIENDGPDCGVLRLEALIKRGVGLMNVIERLHIVSLGEGTFDISSRKGGGAIVRLFIPRIAE